MNPYNAYRRQVQSAGWTRIDMLLGLYDSALTRLGRAEAALQSGQAQAAAGLIARVQLIVSSLASDVGTDVNEEQGKNMVRLYEFVVNELRQPKVEKLASAREVLKTLREGFEAVRAEANELERSGKLPAAEEVRMVHTTA